MLGCGAWFCYRIWGEWVWWVGGDVCCVRFGQRKNSHPRIVLFSATETRHQRKKARPRDQTAHQANERNTAHATGRANGDGRTRERRGSAGRTEPGRRKRARRAEATGRANGDGRTGDRPGREGRTEPGTPNRRTRRRSPGRGRSPPDRTRARRHEADERDRATAERTRRRAEDDSETDTAHLQDAGSDDEGGEDRPAATSDGARPPGRAQRREGSIERRPRNAGAHRPPVCGLSQSAIARAAEHAERAPEGTRPLGGGGCARTAGRA